MNLQVVKDFVDLRKQMHNYSNFTNIDRQLCNKLVDKQKKKMDNNCSSIWQYTYIVKSCKCVLPGFQVMKGWYEFYGEKVVQIIIACPSNICPRINE